MSRLGRVAGVVLAVVLTSGCTAKVPPVVPTAPLPPPVEVPEPSWEQKVAWMLRLEDQRILRDPNPPPPEVLRPATPQQPALLGPVPPTDLLPMLTDREPRVRHRAALSAGRAGLTAGVDPVAKLLADDDPDVRQMAAFALGLMHHASARPALLEALGDSDPIVQSRSAEALGAIGDRADADAVSRMVQAHLKTGVLTGIAADDLTYPMSPAVEAVRLGLYALVRLGSYEALAAAALDTGGRPVSTWWPVAYALQRQGDARAVPALLTLAETPGRYTASFALRGLAAAKAASALQIFKRHVELRQSDSAVVVQAIRGLVALGDTASAPMLLDLVLQGGIDEALRAEAMAAFSALVGASSSDLLVDLLLDKSPAIRAAAMSALARVDADTLMTTLSGLDPDPDWSVRAALATALRGVAPDRSAPLLSSMLVDPDPRVASAALVSLIAAKSPAAEPVLLERLQKGDFAQRASAATALAELNVSRAVPAIVGAYRRAADDDTYVARAAALAALHRLDPAGARPLLTEALQDRDWAVRVRAAALLREQGAPDAAEAIRPAPLRRPIDDPEWLTLASPRFSPHAFIETDKGTIEIELAVLDAPQTVRSFIDLARRGFFDGVAIHRVVPDFVVQGGDPRGDGEGGPGYTIRNEINERPYLRGTVGMALDWEDTGGSQFFITHSPQPHLDGRYTVFAYVVEGMDVVDRIVQGDVVRRLRIWDGVIEMK